MKTRYQSDRFEVVTMALVLATLWVAIIVALAGCGTENDCRTLPGKYQVELVPNLASTAASEFCHLVRGTVDFSSPAALEASCQEQGCDCESDLTVENLACGPRYLKVACPHSPYPNTMCHLYVVDTRDIHYVAGYDYLVKGTCVDDWGTFECWSSATFSRFDND